MEKNDFFGLNPRKAKGNINYFVNRVQNACNNLSNAFNELFDNLYDNWCSPNAAIFASTYNDLIADITKDISDRVSSIVSNACGAYNQVARANGLSTICCNANIYFNKDVKKLLSVSSDGNVGMKITKTENILNDFIIKIEACFNEFDSLPSSIALYDDDNGIHHSYSTRIKELGEKVEKYINNVVIEIRNEIEAEKENLLNAKNNSTNILSRRET